jgi:hypothetical protein
MPETIPTADHYLVQLFLPLRDNAGRPCTKVQFEAVRAELTEKFGGSTAFLRSPALGAWEDGVGLVQHDDVVLVEVVCAELDRAWWGAYRRDLERRFSQEELMMRAIALESVD